ncbi:MAG: tetratricopeptide repeat protein, partial [Myxococcota bacterium]
WDSARRALRCDERFVPALTALVKASLRQGREELAQSILDQALAVDDENAELHFLKGTMLRGEAGRSGDALNEFRRAVQLRPDYTDARMALGLALLAGGNYQEALQNFQAAANLAPQLVAVHLNLADAYRATKQWTKAKQSFDQALRMDANLAQAHFNMGLMYMAAGADYPELDELGALRQAREEFRRYRDMMGPRLGRNDPSEQYLSDLDRQISRTERRIERERRRAEMEAERGVQE